MRRQKPIPLDKDSISVISSISSRQSLEEDNKARKIILTVLICISYLCLGCFKAIPGPTLYILRRLADGAKTESLMLVFTSRSLGYICGYILGGALFDSINVVMQKRLIISFVVVLCAGTSFVVPFCHGLMTLTAAFFGAGLTISILDTGFNTLILHMWGRKGNPYFLALQFLNGVGGLSAVLLQRIFVQDISAAQAMANKTLHLVPEDMGTSTFPELLYSYIILCGFLGLVAIFWFLSLFCPCNEVTLGAFQIEVDIKIPTKEFTVFAVITTSLLTFLCGTISLGYQHMIATYAMEGYNFSTKSTVDLTAFFWGFYALGGFISIFAAKVFHPFIMIIACLVLELASGLVLVLLSKSDNDMLAVGNVFLGLGAAALFGWSVLWMDRYIVTTYKIISALLIAQCLAEMIVPPVLAFALTKSTNSLSYFVLYIPIIYFIVFAIQCIWLFTHGEKFIRISSLPKKKNKHRYFPIFLETRRRRSDPQILKTAMETSGIDLEKPFMVSRRDSPVQTDTSRWAPRVKTKESGIQVQFFTRQECRSSLKIAKENMEKIEQEKVAEEEKTSEPLAILGGFFGLGKKKASKEDASDQRDEKEAPKQRKTAPQLVPVAEKTEKRTEKLIKKPSRQEDRSEQPKQKKIALQPVTVASKTEKKVEKPVEKSIKLEDVSEEERDESEELEQKKSAPLPIFGSIFGKSEKKADQPDGKREDKPKESEESEKPEREKSFFGSIFGKPEKKADGPLKPADELEKPKKLKEKEKPEKLKEEEKPEEEPEKKPEKKEESPDKTLDKDDEAKNLSEKPEEPEVINEPIQPSAESGKLEDQNKNDVENYKPRESLPDGRRKKSSWFYANIMH